MTTALPSVDRPDPRQLYLTLLTGLFIGAMTCGMGLIGLIPLLIRYFTTRYRFDEEGVGVMWGFLFRKESYITFDKIQDIHLNRGFLERQFGLGTVDVQTASASAGAEISLFGLREFDSIRDFLYTRMRGEDSNASQKEEAPVEHDETLALLTAIRDEVQRLGQRMGSGGGGVSLSPPSSEGP